MQFTPKSIKTAERMICRVGGTTHNATRSHNSKNDPCQYATTFRRSIKKLVPEYSAKWGKLEHDIALLILSEVMFEVGLPKAIAQAMSVLGLKREDFTHGEQFDLDRMRPVFKELDKLNK